MGQATAAEVKTCKTCVHMATHERCDGCLHTDDDWKAYHAKHTARMESGERGDWPQMDYRYLNYEEGNWLKRVEEFENSGRRNIVIGGQGEAEVNTQWTPEETFKHLCYVAGECGYLCRRAKDANSDRLEVRVYLPHGAFAVVYCGDTMSHIERMADPTDMIGGKRYEPGYSTWPTWPSVIDARAATIKVARTVKAA